MRKALFILERFVRGINNRFSTLRARILLGNVGRGSVIRRHCRLEGDRLDCVSLGKGCDVDTYCVIGCRDRLGVPPILSIGDGCVFGQYNHITAVNKICIGDNLLTGRFVLITDNSHSGTCKEELSIHPSLRQVVSKGEVVIGKNVWLGDKVSILSGVHIGDGSIIGANSIVSHDIPAYSVAAGNPAHVIRSLIKD